MSRVENASAQYINNWIANILYISKYEHGFSVKFHIIRYCAMSLLHHCKVLCKVMATILQHKAVYWNVKKVNHCNEPSTMQIT